MVTNGLKKQCMPLEDLINAEQAAVKANRGSPDSAEGMRAFMEKRKPVFNQH